MHDIDEFKPYHEKKVRERTGNLTKKDILLEDREFLQSLIVQKGKEKEIQARIQDEKLVIINRKREVVYTFISSEADNTIKLFKILGIYNE